MNLNFPKPLGYHADGSSFCLSCATRLFTNHKRHSECIEITDKNQYRCRSCEVFIGSKPVKYLADISKKEIAGQLRWLNRISASATVDDKTKQAASTLKACLESIYDTKS